MEQLVSEGVWCWWLLLPHSEDPHLGYFSNMLLHLALPSLVCNPILCPNLLCMVWFTTVWDLLFHLFVISNPSFAQFPASTFLVTTGELFTGLGSPEAPQTFSIQPLLLPPAPCIPTCRSLLSHHSDAPLCCPAPWRSQIDCSTQNNHLLLIYVERNMVPHNYTETSQRESNYTVATWLLKKIWGLQLSKRKQNST